MLVSMYHLSHLTDRDLLRDLAALVTQDRATTAALLAHLAEVDERKLYLPAAYPWMYAYCVGELRLSEASALKRIQAARTARRFPTIFPALAEGRMHVSAVCLLAPYLTEDSVAELLAVAGHKTKSEIEQLLAVRFPRPDVPARVQAIASALPIDPLAAGTVVTTAEQLAGGTVEQHAPGHVGTQRSRLSPLAP
jgi:hypothetical protein